MFAFRTTIGPVELAFTDRHGGVSAAPFDSLNLSIAGEDDERAKAENHRLLLAEFAPGAHSHADLYQVHSSRVVVLERGAGPGRPEADGIVTARAGTPLLVRAADCVPVLFADPERGVVGAAHAGRRGVQADVVTRVVDTMAELGASGVHAWIGPHICGRCYEVPALMREEVAAAVPATWAETSWGTPSLDLGAGIAAQLGAAGVQVHLQARCTLEDDDFFSYRRDAGRSGRHAGIVMLRERP
ncbi:MAG: peptidoglycan editing factor PgeF [Nocardioides sp.]